MNFIKALFFKYHTQKNMSLGIHVSDQYPVFFRTTMDGLFFYKPDGKIRFIRYCQLHCRFMKKLNEI